jgi:hypothetical protein
LARSDPDWSEANIWRKGKLPDGYKAPFSDAMKRARAKGCMAVGVRDADFCKVDGAQLTEIMGWDEPAPARLN